MKTKNLLSVFLALFSCVGIVGCSFDDDEPKDWTEYKTYIVSDHKVERKTAIVPSSESVVRQYLELIDENGKILYLLGEEIKGFEYEEGYIYKIKVKIIHLAEPPQDGSNLRYVLDKLLSKEKEDTL
ncbi:MAG: DUF4377 domain-containing protein [Flavobacteriaceae bacterium]|nr:DUF4377 domain-containing protein [Flavobacteriaceae bacterium]